MTLVFLSKQYPAEYAAWANAKYRCNTTTCDDYKDYGGRGITMSVEFANSFATFLACVGARPTSKHSLDRIDNALGYERGNVRWATKSEQMKNRRVRHDAIMLTANGQTMTLPAWSKALGLSVPTIRYRVKAGWRDDEALGLVPRQK